MEVDVRQLQDFAKANTDAPQVLLEELRKGFAEIGRTDMEDIRANVASKLSVNAKGLLKSFKAKSTDAGRATSIEKLFVDESTRWKPASIFQTGGTIVGHGKKLTILIGEGRGESGRRKYTAAKIRQLIAEKKITFVPTPRGVLLILNKGGTTKAGKLRKGSASVIIAILKQQVTEKKRLDFLETFNANEARHIEILEFAIENTLAYIASSKGN